MSWLCHTVVWRVEWGGSQSVTQSLAARVNGGCWDSLTANPHSPSKKRLVINWWRALKDYLVSSPRSPALPLVSSHIPEDRYRIMEGWMIHSASHLFHPSSRWNMNKFEFERKIQKVLPNYRTSFLPSIFWEQLWELALRTSVIK